MADTKRKYPIPVGTSILLNNQGQFLLGQKANGLWECMGGKVEDEPVREGARRELEEEIGVVAIGDGLYLGYTESFGSGKNNAHQRFVNHHFYWPVWKGEPRIVEPEKCQKLQWVRPVDLLSLGAMTQGTKLFTESFIKLSELMFGCLSEVNNRDRVEEVLENMRLVGQ